MNPHTNITAFNVFDNIQSQNYVENAKDYTELQNFNQPSTSNEKYISENSAATAILQGNNNCLPISNADAQEVIINFKCSIYLIF